MIKQNEFPSTDPATNIKFVGRPVRDRGNRKVLQPNDPIERIAGAAGDIVLPAAADQKANRFFYHADAVAIAQAFPHLYKLKVNK